MLTVKTHPLYKIEDEKFTIAVVAARYKGKLVFVRRRSLKTWEMPGGHREGNETILETAKRELFEETGASIYRIVPVCAYTVEDEGSLIYGVLFVADIEKLGELPKSEIGEVRLFSEVPTDLTFPSIQAKLSIISLPHELCDGMGKDVSIRWAQYIDVEDICHLFISDRPSTGNEDADEIIRIEEEFRLRTAEHRLRTTIEKENYKTFIAYNGIRPAGVCSVKLTAKSPTDNTLLEGSIELLHVAEGYRRAGVGRHLMSCALKLLRDLECPYASVWLSASDEELREIYTLQGFSFDGNREMTDTGMRLHYRREVFD